jgi:hypothetical protein
VAEKGGHWVKGAGGARFVAAGSSGGGSGMALGVRGAAAAAASKARVERGKLLMQERQWRKENAGWSLGKKATGKFWKLGTRADYARETGGNQERLAALRGIEKRNRQIVAGQMAWW